MDILGQIVFYRSYSRRTVANTRESFEDMASRVIQGLGQNLGLAELYDAVNFLKSKLVFPSGRYLWVGGTEWLDNPDNYPGAYNCTSLDIIDWDSFIQIMDLSMMGCGTGANLLHIDQLPAITTHVDVSVISVPIKNERSPETIIENNIVLVGDSRQGWCDALRYLLNASSSGETKVNITFDLTNIRPKGTKLKGFGGVANPSKLPSLFFRITQILNNAVGRKLSATECCLVLGVVGDVVVSGNIRRSAGIRQANFNDQEFADSKQNLWINVNNKWVVDPAKDVLRLANHTRACFHKPTLAECIESVSKQFYSGEGAIQYAPEALARANADLLYTKGLRKEFLKQYHGHNGSQFLAWQEAVESTNDPSIRPQWHQFKDSDKQTSDHRLLRYGLNPCGEIIGHDFLCNLSEVHLNLIDPFDIELQKQTFAAAANIAASLLHHQFNNKRLQASREVDPIIGVSFTGLFDFFVNAFGVEWLRWWQSGRVDSWNDNNQTINNLLAKFNKNSNLQYQYLSDLFRDIEKEYLRHWKQVVFYAVANYCQSHQLKMPNRCTTVQPAGTKSLLTGASPGWHPPKAYRYIRRVTFQANDPLALAAMDLGYSVIPSQSDKDDQGHLLDDPFDPRCTEWLVEIPIKISWADLPGIESTDISKFSALAQFDFYMTVQKYYTTHNTSGTIEVREYEIGALGERIYNAIKNDEGYISVALLARFDNYQAFPRLPFEPISEARYQQLLQDIEMRKACDDFDAALAKRDNDSQLVGVENGPAGCDSDKCLL